MLSFLPIMQHILIVENDRPLAQTIKAHLQSRNYQCTVTSNLDDSYTELEQFKYDLVILDRVLDDGDGIELLPFLTDCAFQTKSIVLSQKSQVLERIRGLEQGADDYVPKPFSLTELTLKVEKLLHTQKLTQTPSITAGGLTIFPESGQIVMPNASKILRKKEMQILACLLQQKDQVVSRDKIIDTVWSFGSQIPTQTTLDVYIRRIRIQLGDMGKRIKTVRGFGYLFDSAES